MCLVTGVWNEGEMSPGVREMVTSSGEREERRPGLMTTELHSNIKKNDAHHFTKNIYEHSLIDNNKEWSAYG